MLCFGHQLSPVQPTFDDQSMTLPLRKRNRIRPVRSWRGRVEEGAGAAQSVMEFGGRACPRGNDFLIRQGSKSMLLGDPLWLTFGVVLCIFATSQQNYIFEVFLVSTPSVGVNACYVSCQFSCCGDCRSPAIRQIHNGPSRSAQGL